MIPVMVEVVMMSISFAVSSMTIVISRLLHRILILLQLHPNNNSNINYPFQNPN
jgi:hypothetical protein